MGTNHTYRYINATAVYSYGYSAGGGGTGKKYSSGSVTTSSSGESKTISCGFQPKIIIIYHFGSNGDGSSIPKGSIMIVYNSYKSSSYQYTADYNTGGNGYFRVQPASVTGTNFGISSVSSSGFTFKAATSSSSAYQGTHYWYAVG